MTNGSTNKAFTRRVIDRAAEDLRADAEKAVEVARKKFTDAFKDKTASDFSYNPGAMWDLKHDDAGGYASI